MVSAGLSIRVPRLQGSGRRVEPWSDRSFFVSCDADRCDCHALSVRVSDLNFGGLSTLLWGATNEWTQVAAAVKLGISKSRLCDLEAGRRLVSVELARTIAEAAMGIRPVAILLHVPLTLMLLGIVVHGAIAANNALPEYRGYRGLAAGFESHAKIR